MKFLKNISLAGILTALFAVVFTTNAYSNEVTIIKTSPQSNVFVGQNITLTAIVIPDHGQELVWWSGDGRATVVQDNQGRYIFNATQSGTIRVHVMEQLYNTSQYFDIEVMASNEPTIQSISLSGLTAPVAGQLPQNTINTNDSRIIQPNFVWQRQSGNDWNTFSGSFNSNTNYRLVLTLTTNHPSGFAVNVPVSVNTGTVSANQTNNLNAMSITRYITFPTTAVDNADINITGLTVPIAGALPVNANNVNTQQSGINVTNVVWERSQGGNWVNFQGNFGSNNAYRAILTITTNANAGFASNIIVAAPGGTITGNNSSGSAEITRIVTFPNTESVPTYAINGLTQPSNGNMPVTSANVTINQPGINVTNVSWQTYNGNGNWGSFSGTFTANGVYRATLTITSNQTGGFRANQIFTAAGGAIYGSNNQGANSITRIVQFGIPVTPMVITGIVAPATGAAPILNTNVLNVTGQQSVNITNINWQRNAGNNANPNWVAAGATFTGNSVYRANITLTRTAVGGFVLNQPFTVAGGEVTGTNNQGAASITRIVTFPVTVDTTVSSVDITGLFLPVIGQTPVISANIDATQTNVDVINAVWQRLGTMNTWVPAELTFSAGASYRVTLTITTSSPQGFIANVPVITPGGEVTGTNNSGDTTITRIVEFSPTSIQNAPVTSAPISFNATFGITVNGILQNINTGYWGNFEINSDGVSVLPARLAFSLLFDGLDPMDPEVFVWNAATSSFIIDPNGHNIVFQVGNPQMTVGGLSRSILSGAGLNAFAVAPYVDIATGRMMLPVRAFADALNLNVGWDAATSTVTLTQN